MISKISFIRRLLVNTILLISIFPFYAYAQPRNVVVDAKGVIRWENDGKEIMGFGVNYTVPFAHAYRSAKKLGIDLKQAIDKDIYHFSRLGFDLYRVHVWDTEISDTLGNLVDNEHLELFDYLLLKLGERNINYVITPIAFWGNGWPEPDDETPGFSHRYGKDACLTNPDAIKAQHNYLKQFLNHTNRYTGISYKDDPRLIAVEVSNEPHHRQPADSVTQFVKGMVDAIRSTGIQKPVFYNVSHAVHLMDNYFQAGINGGTFQWYPTGLGYQLPLQGNLLPNVDRYEMPFDSVIKAHGGAKIVYEFDAADVAQNYIYPAMARSFREAGIQIGTHFAYDPTFLAYANTEYNTHYMNLAYTPKKALALKIAGEIFHQMPRYDSYGRYPTNLSFGSFSISYEKDLAIMNTSTSFIYTNDTEVQPVNSSKLTTISGAGSSPIVNYSGEGAYFMDRLEKGVWRLEVMPDPAWVQNPFGRNSLNKTVGVIQWNTQQMKINLPDLGSDFTIVALDEGNDWQTSVLIGSFDIRPGTYLVTASNKKHNWKTSSDWQGGKLGEFAAPASTVEKLWVRHEPAKEINEHEPYKISAQIVSHKPIEKVEAWVMSGWKPTVIELDQVSTFGYETILDAALVKAGALNYYLLVYHKNGTVRTYPADEDGKPFDWDFYQRDPYSVRVIPSDFPIQLFDAANESDLLMRPWIPYRLVPTPDSHAEFELTLLTLFKEDPENLGAEPIHDYTMKHFVADLLKVRVNSLSNITSIRLEGRSLGQATKIQIALVQSDGATYGNVIEIDQHHDTYTINLDDFKRVKTVTLPRPYPTFLPYFFTDEYTSTFDLSKVESLQISIGPGLSPAQINLSHTIAIKGIWLQ